MLREPWSSVPTLQHRPPCLHHDREGLVQTHPLSPRPAVNRNPTVQRACVRQPIHDLCLKDKLLVPLIRDRWVCGLVDPHGPDIASPKYYDDPGLRGSAAATSNSPSLRGLPAQAIHSWDKVRYFCPSKEVPPLGADLPPYSV